jgi:adenine-specific DNA-methyltransferase
MTIPLDGSTPPPDPQRSVGSSWWPEPSLHPLQRRYLAEDLVRLRRSDERRRYVAPQRAGKIDPNPHQVEAVIFALSRHREGGCILADEVGLGKTIEAGLVMAQLLAEGASRILLIAPKTLLGQWRDELFRLFDLEAREADAKPGSFDGPGIFLIGREAAGSERGHGVLFKADAFDLCVIDEAHEVFAGIHKRFDRHGLEKADSEDAQTAARVREVLRKNQTPVLLLTATPIQNSLAELWGLVQYVDPDTTLLGDLATFREVFCGDDDRQLAKGQEYELRSRLRSVLQRTLRRQAQEFLDKPFVERHARQFEYAMSARERSLYDDVTRYLLEPGIVAFRGSHRQLLLTGFHRRMASSTRALAKSLGRVAGRLRRMLKKEATAEGDAADVRDVLNDLEEDEPTLADAEDTDAPSSAPSHTPEQIRAELLRVESFVARAEGLSNEDSKFRALLKALTFVTERSRGGQGSGKLVVFTESVSTQEYLRDRLLESQLVGNDEITLFRGTNDGPEAAKALARWRDEVPQNQGGGSSKAMGVRLALVHEFRTRSRVFISTEAGAKGLNLQFCETVVNYDLPWNPQRIEQRIGRCHRYGQKHEVTVVNFLAKDNEAELLMFEILSQKLNLFGTVLDASDHVLHRPDDIGAETLVGVLGADVESALRRIWDRSRTPEEVLAQLRALREQVGEKRKRFEETHARTASVIEERFDLEVQKAFQQRKAELPLALEEFDRDVLRVVLGYLVSRGIPFERKRTPEGSLLQVSPSPELPEGLRAGVTVAIGSLAEHTALHLGHPLVIAAVDDARRATSRASAVTISLPVDASPELTALRGQTGRLRLLKVRHDGFERAERLVPVAVIGRDGQPLRLVDAEALLRGLLCDRGVDAATIANEVMDDAAEEVLFSLQSNVDVAEHTRFESAVKQNERFVEDRLLILHRRRDAAERKLEASEGRRDAAIGAERRTEMDYQVTAAQVVVEEMDAKIGGLERREDTAFQRHREQLHAKRYAKPQVEQLFEMELVIE